MTSVCLACDDVGRLKYCGALGHAEYAKKGYDIVCAAESVLLRTVLDLLKKESDIRLKSEMGRRGSLSFSVEYTGELEAIKQRLRCFADFLREGFSSLAEEYPEHVSFEEKIVGTSKNCNF